MRLNFPRQDIMAQEDANIFAVIGAKTLRKYILCA